MVYPGGPSKGCYTCRARKVKVRVPKQADAANDNIGQCDESRPVCNRCVKGNRACGGYRDLSDQISPSRHPTPSQASQEGDQVAKSLTKLSIFPGTILGHSPEEERNNVTAFVQQIVSLPQGQSLHAGLLTAYPPVLAGLEPHLLALSPLPPALSALFLVFVSDKRDEKYRGAVTGAMASYGKALQLTRRLMDELVEPRRFELVLTIFALGMYEVCVLLSHPPGP